MSTRRRKENIDDLIRILTMRTTVLNRKFLDNINFKEYSTEELTQLYHTIKRDQKEWNTDESDMNELYYKLYKESYVTLDDDDLVIIFRLILNDNSSEDILEFLDDTHSHLHRYLSHRDDSDTNYGHGNIRIPDRQLQLVNLAFNEALDSNDLLLS